MVVQILQNRRVYLSQRGTPFVTFLRANTLHIDICVAFTE